jgi:2'-5' RNA ligase
VLVPPARVQKRAIGASRRLRSAIRLGPRAVPHVTLAMAVVPASALEAIVAGLRDAALRHLPIEVTVRGAVGVPGSRHVNAWLEIARSPELLRLHQDALLLLNAHRLRQRAQRGMLAVLSGERVAKSTLRWIDHFADDSAGRRYRPHITLGQGQPAATAAFTFRANGLGLYQLGNHCTCARPIAEVPRRL